MPLYQRKMSQCITYFSSETVNIYVSGVWYVNFYIYNIFWSINIIADNKDIVVFWTIDWWNGDKNTKSTVASCIISRRVQVGFGYLFWASQLVVSATHCSGPAIACPVLAVQRDVAVRACRTASPALPVWTWQNQLTYVVSRSGPITKELGWKLVVYCLLRCPGRW